MSETQHRSRNRSRHYQLSRRLHAGRHPGRNPGEDGERLIPSVVAWTTNGVAIGNAARALDAGLRLGVYFRQAADGRDLTDIEAELKLFLRSRRRKPGETLRLNVGGLT